MKPANIMKLRPQGLTSTTSLHRDRLGSSETFMEALTRVASNADGRHRSSKFTTDSRQGDIKESRMGSVMGSKRGNVLDTKNNMPPSLSRLSSQNSLSAMPEEESTDAISSRVTGHVEFANIGRKKSSVKAPRNDSAGKNQALFKLIDFGTAVGIHEDEDIPEQESMMTITELEFAG